MNNLNEIILTQLYLLIVFCISGAIIGIFFDFFRILRRLFKTSDLMTSIQDVIFWILTGIFLLFIIFCYNEGEIRSYVFIGILLGLLIYFLIFSKIIIRINLSLFLSIKKFLPNFVKK